jgi:hypothetical protein
MAFPGLYRVCFTFTSVEMWKWSKQFIAKFQFSKLSSFLNLLLVEIKKLFGRELSAS